MYARSLITLLIPLMIIGCSDGSSEVGPGGVSAEDARALDDAAAKLDAEAAGEQTEPESKASN
jgi:hypothetical protein